MCVFVCVCAWCVCVCVCMCVWCVSMCVCGMCEYVCVVCVYVRVWCVSMCGVCEYAIKHSLLFQFGHYLIGSLQQAVHASVNATYVRT